MTNGGVRERASDRFRTPPARSADPRLRGRQPGVQAGEERAMQRMRERLAGIPGAQYEFTRPSLLTLSTPVEVILAGYDLDRLSLAANLVRERMERSGAFRDIRSSIEGGHPEIQILFDQERASQLGLAVRDIADRVVSNVRGSVATRYRLQEKKIDVLVRSVDTRAASIEEVRNLVVNPGSDRPVPLSAVAEVRLATGPAEIRRANQERVAVISAAPADGDLGNATREAQALLAATTTVLALALNSMAGYAFAKLRFAGRDGLFRALLAGLLVPAQVAMLPLFLLLKQLGLVNTWAGVVIPGMASIFGIFLVRQYALSIPDALLDAARVDGAGELRIYRSIVLPVCRPVLLTLGVLTFMGSWNDFLWPLVVLTDDSMYTLPVALANLLGEHVQDVELMMAGSVLTVAPVVVLFFALQRHYVEGIVSGALRE